MDLLHQTFVHNAIKLSSRREFAVDLVQKTAEENRGTIAAGNM